MVYLQQANVDIINENNFIHHDIVHDIITLFGKGVFFRSEIYKMEKLTY